MILIIGRGNDKIDKFIQDAQLNADDYDKVLEWISFERFKDVKQIDPEIHSFMMVLQYSADGNLRKYLKINFNEIRWNQKLFNLWDLSNKLKDIHELDFGLSKQIGKNPNNPEKKNIVGVLPYIAPEVLSGDEEYTKAADVYSFGIIAYEMITGFPLYPDIPHNKDLAMKICNGLRLKIPFHTPKLIRRMIMKCWDARVTHRPTIEELHDELWKYWSDYRSYLNESKNKDSEIVIQIKKAEEFSANQNSTNTTTTTPLNYQTHHKQFILVDFLIFQNFQNPRTKKISNGNLKN
ncbi:hypothetical protein Glove_557g55 [Diversispora epigaea]|uniref:Protein kinase domain-containing protein n=1 Tax=Diversispora epigaea TaxID=1348612 RepID=A0A397GEP2_9GLOM|nr:hypothetical protein Glove_557g55 [Diversispora epigaea]